MISLTERIWIGGWNSEYNATPLGITAVLNVAQDLQCVRGWPDIEAMHVGLVDGPGNPVTAYHSAVLALSTLLSRHKKVLVCCHGGSRSVAVAMMYLIVVNGQTWEKVEELLNERSAVKLPPSHKAHREVFDQKDWYHLRRIILERP